MGADVPDRGDTRALRLLGHHRQRTRRLPADRASGRPAGGLDFGNTPLSRIHVTFEALADLPGGADATHATAINCTDNNDVSVDGSSGTNSRDTVAVRTSQSSVTCVISYEDP